MSKARQKFTKILLMAVSALGISSTALLITDPPPPEIQNADIFSTNGSTLRTIASVDTTPEYETLFDFTCGDNTKELETFSPRFRLKGENCAVEDSQPITTQIRNKTNGYVATVFHRAPLNFTTDYINLKEGKNEIDVRFETNKGTVEKSLTVTRLPASAKKHN
ncbi:MAG: hypothetical protein SGI74_11330 [Oligoflexia bacterium]|nr:hypothetical protein [Oligoflexia bacterium]